jgi:hypothetical protein
MLNVAERDVANMAEEPANAISARTAVPLAARVVVIHVDALSLLERLMAHAAGVVLHL